jgi:hypothetical protein
LFNNSLLGLFSGLRHKAQATTGPSQGHLPASSIQILYIDIFLFLINIIIYQNKYCQNGNKQKFKY